MDLERREVEHIAKLSRIALAPGELETFPRQLGAILGYVETLKELDVTKVEPLVHPGDLRNVFRDDVPKPGLSNDDAVGNAPEKEGPFFKVPRVIE